MRRKLNRIGNSRGLVLTRTMLDHLGAEDEVEVTLERGRIVITAAGESAPASPEPDESKPATIAQYDDAMRWLADGG